MTGVQTCALPICFPVTIDVKMLSNLSAITKATLVDEMKLHHLYMKEFGISDEEVQNVRASLFNRTYTANMLATAIR